MNTAKTDDDEILDLEQFLPYRLARAYEKVSRKFAVRYRDRYGMTRPEWRVFATLGQFGNRTATEIGRHSSMHKTKVSRAVVALEKRGWLFRESDRIDRRIEHLSLTKNGKSAYRDMVKVARQFEEAFNTELGAVSLEKLSSGLDAIERMER